MTDVAVFCVFRLPCAVPAVAPRRLVAPIFRSEEGTSQQILSAFGYQLAGLQNILHEI